MSYHRAFLKKNIHEKYNRYAMQTVTRTRKKNNNNNKNTIIIHTNNNNNHNNTFES